MQIVFRPLLGLTIASTILCAILIGLGVWQLERLQWKLGLIDHVNRLLTAPPVSLNRAFRIDARANVGLADYRRVKVDGRLLNDREIYVYATAPDGGAGYHVITPLVMDGNKGVLLVDRGFVPPPLRSPAARVPGELDGKHEIVGVLRSPDADGLFTPKPDLANRVFYVRNLSEMASLLKSGNVFPMFLDADAAPNPGGWPKGGLTQIAFRNEHLQYAITWFALAAGLLGVYLAYHVSRGRLSIRR